jgi:hypothetical protein
MTDSQPTLSSLAAKITELSQNLTKQLQEKNIPAPTFAPDSPINYKDATAEIFMARQVLCDALMDMWYLTQGPSESIYNYVHNVPQSICSQTNLKWWR